MACCKKGNGASKHLDYFAVATVIGTIIVTGVVLTGFWTSSWVVVDPEKYPASVPSFNIFFHKLGLWEICLRLYRPGSPYAYQKFSMMCESVISTTNQNFHAPAFLTATQVLYSIGLGVVIIAAITIVIMLGCGPTRKVLSVLGVLFMVAGLSICLAVAVFASCIFDKDGIFGKEQNNDFGWSFWLGVSGGVLLWFCGACYFVAGRRLDIYHEDHFTKFIF